MATLRRHRDGEGHCGPVVYAISLDGDKVSDEPTVGHPFFISSVTAGTFSNRDWWLTTPVTEIVSKDDDKVVFKTGNSVYTLAR